MSHLAKERVKSNKQMTNEVKAAVDRLKEVETTWRKFASAITTQDANTSIQQEECSTPKPAESEDVTIKTILGHSGEIIVVAKQGLATVSISLEGLMQAAVIGRTSTVEEYRTALKNLSLELLEWSIEK